MEFLADAFPSGDCLEDAGFTFSVEELFLFLLLPTAAAAAGGTRASLDLDLASAS